MEKNKKEDILLPRSTELETSILGEIILFENVSEVSGILKAEDFYHKKHQTIYSTIIELHNKQYPVNVSSICSTLIKKGLIEDAGGVAYVSSLGTNILRKESIEFKARVLLEYSTKRKLLFLSEKIKQRAIDEMEDVFDILDFTEKEIFEILSFSRVSRNYSLKEVLDDVFKRAENAQRNGVYGQIKTGYPSIDNKIGGFSQGELIILAARPGMGKTAFALNIARNVAIRQNKGVAIFSLEMSSIQLGNRILSSEAKVNSKNILTGKISEGEWRQLTYAFASLEDSPIIINDTPALSVYEFRNIAKKLKRSNDIGLIVVDYLQLMTTGDKFGGKRESEISTISRTLKAIAKEIEVPIIALSQLSRAVESRGDKRPILSDIRESGAIEQDADSVLFLYRDSYYDRNSENDNTEVICAKNRNGETFVSELYFNAPFTLFEEINRQNFNNPFKPYQDKINPFANDKSNHTEEGRNNEHPNWTQDTDEVPY